MPQPPQHNPDGRSSTASHRAAAGASNADFSLNLPPLKPGSSVVSLSAVHSPDSLPNSAADESPTVITSRQPDDHGVTMPMGGRLGHFELIETVGAGGMAAVLKARDLELGRIVALKILPPQMARDPENVARFKQEARAAARLDHDNVARVFFCGDDNGQHFIAFEFIEGDNLRTLIDRSGTIPAGECIRYMAQVAAGLAHAAARGVVHRDVKPSNIVITPDGRAKIVDMGLARSFGATQSVNGGVTQSGVTLGTFDYISPEQALDPRRADVRSDIYSLGCAFYHALTGRPPVPEGTAMKKLQAHQHDPVVDPRVLNPTVPDGLAAVLARMMAKDPNRRYQTPAELIADLAVVAARLNLSLDGLSSDLTTASSAPTVGRLLADPPRVPVGLVIGLAGLAVAVVILIGLNASPNRTVAMNTSPATKPSPAIEIPATPVKPTVEKPNPLARVHTAADLVEVLRQPEVVEIRLDAEKEYDLVAAAPQGVAVAGRTLRIVGTTGLRAPTIKIAAVPISVDQPEAARPGSLTVARSQSVRFEGVRFLLVDPIAAPVEPDETDPLAMRSENQVGLAIVDSERVVFDGCRFEAGPDLRAAQVAGVSVARGSAEKPTDLQVSHCYFAVRKATAVRLCGRVNASVEESLFAPHQSAFELNPRLTGNEFGTDDASDSLLQLTHCSFLMGSSGAVAEARLGQRWQVAAGWCVFAGSPPPPADGMGMIMMMPSDVPTPRVVVLRVKEGAAAKYVGRSQMRNAYYRVDPMAAGPKVVTASDAAQSIDPDAVDLKESPWVSAKPQDELSGTRPWVAMRLRATYPPVRDPKEVLLGARVLWVDPVTKEEYLYEPWPPSPQVVASNQKVWWPNPPPEKRGQLARNEFESLADIVKVLQPNDEVLIRLDGTGPLKVPTIAIKGAKSRVTIKPEREGSPTVLIPDDAQSDAPLFQVDDGELILEGLHFRLQGEAGGRARSRAVMTVAGGSCKLRRCTVTLDEQSGDRFASVAVPDSRDGGTPHIEFENCLVRGSGRLAWIQAARPFDLSVHNSVVALSGPLVAIDPATRAFAEDAETKITLDGLTSVLAGSVLDVRLGGTADSPEPRLVVEASQSIFAPLNGKPRPLVTVTGAAVPLTRILKWKQFLGANWYDQRPVNTSYLEMTSADESVEPKMFAAEEWFAFAEEKAGKSVGSVTFAKRPRNARSLLNIAPTDLAVTDIGIAATTPSSAGAEVEKVAKTADDGPVVP